MIPPALLAAVIARPDDDTPRLAYADWLEETAGAVVCPWCEGSGEDRPPRPVEHGGKRLVYVGPLGPCPKCGGAGQASDGRRERAEFIRVQCELARLPAEVVEIADYALSLYAGAALGAGRGSPLALRARERGLLCGGNPPNAIRWAALPKLWDGSAWWLGNFEGDDSEYNCRFEFRRGFIDSLRLPFRDWRDHADALLARHPVRAVTLSTPVDWCHAGEVVVFYRGRHPRIEGDEYDCRRARVRHPAPFGDPAARLREYLSAEWPQVPEAGWHVAQPGHIALAVERLERDLIRGLGIPPELADPPA